MTCRFHNAAVSLEISSLVCPGAAPSPYCAPSEVSGTIYEDDDADGVEDPGESGLDTVVNIVGFAIDDA